MHAMEDVMAIEKLIFEEFPQNCLIYFVAHTS